MEELGNACKTLVGNMKKRYHLGVLNICGRLVIMWISRK
jgi:hypothetical protein